ncbi:MAG: endonuclease/exonuclease/phosphatase family protein [Pseudomonadota bacterium]
MAQSWRIVTYNTWKCDGRYRERLNWMGQGLKALAPDVVCLQEAFDCPERDADTARELSSVLGMQAEVLPARQKLRLFEGDRRTSRSNLAILAKRPMTRLEDTKLPGHAADNDRWAMQVNIPTGAGARLRIINTHFTHLRDQAGPLVRAAQAERVASLTDLQAFETVILCGDFNDEWDSPSLKPLSVRPWLEPQDDEGGATFIGASPDSPVSPRRLDHIQVASAPSDEITVRNRSRALAMPVGPNNEYPSDHAALVIDLEIGPPRRGGA